jgi:DNA mismatch repair protein MutS
MAKYTPMIEQYLQIKQEAGDAFLFFRLGDFYEMFFEDAILAAKELEITLTGRDGGADERIPMCGVPYHSADQYIAKLIEKGYKVAICEQVEDPALAKGVVKREIVRIITPGTVMDGKAVGEAKNNFLVCLACCQGNYGLAACDLTTGELYETSAALLDHLLEEAQVYTPSEIITEGAIYEQVKKAVSSWPGKVVVTHWQAADASLAERHFSPEVVRALSAAAKYTVSFLLSYLQETQKRTLSHLLRVKSYEAEQYMTLDPFTRRNLELVETVRDRSKKGTLLWLLDQTMTSMGSRLLRRWIDKPLMQKQAIEARLEAVERLHHQFIVRDELRRCLKEVYDLERLVGRIAYGNANARDLVALKHSLQQVPAIFAAARSAESHTLNRLLENADDCREVREWIEAAIVDDPPVSLKEGGMIRTGYHERLDRLREASTNGKQWIAELEQKERRETGIKSLKVGFNKVFGYYIEVTKANLHALPEGRYERKQTLANAERFVTAELKEKEALILEAEEKMADLEYELFVELRGRLAGQTTRLQKLAETIAAIDVYQSLATVSAAQRFCKPEISDGGDLVISQGRHAVVEAVLDDGQFVANDTALHMNGKRMLLITGPNMAGKSTYMRQVALICIMAQIGSFVPAQKAVIPLIDRIFTRIGAADDLIGGNSTFMVEMKDIQVMTAKATKRSLVIIDELGRGTSTAEGMAIAQAVIEYLHGQIGCKTLVSTHFHELAHLEERLPGLANYSMAVKESGDEVIFLRKLVRGAASTSYGIYCAQIAGIPGPIIARAYELLNELESRAAALAEPAAVKMDAEQPDSGAGPAAAGSKMQPAEPEQAAGKRDMAAAASEAAAAAVKEEAELDGANGIVQLSLFPDVPEDSDRKKLSRREREVLAKLQSVDLMGMTPLDAMNFIYALKQQLTQP